MIQAQNIQKEFGSFRAVDGVNLQVDRGECFGLLGPNGAGKTTLIHMLYGMVRRTQGDLKVFGKDPSRESRAIKKRIGVVTQENALDEALTVYENMRLYCSFLGLPNKEHRPKILELLEYMNLAHKKDENIKALSGGMKRRLVFVRALLGDPELLILDEPTTGLDPAVRHLLWGKVQELHSQGVTILLTTHYMHEAEVLCSRLAILNQGKVVAEGSPQKMIQAYTPGYVAFFPLAEEHKLQKVASSSWDLVKEKTGITLRAPALEEITQLHSLHNLAPLQIRPANLEDVFLKLTGSELHPHA